MGFIKGHDLNHILVNPKNLNLWFKKVDFQLFTNRSYENNHRAI